MGGKRVHQRRNALLRRPIRPQTASPTASPRTTGPAADLDAHWRLAAEDGETPDQAARVKPWLFSECVHEDGRPIMLEDSPATSAQNTSLTADNREVFLRWPFYVLKPGRDRTNTTVTCLLHFHRQLHALDPSVTLDTAIDKLLALENTGKLVWHPDDYSYIVAAPLHTGPRADPPVVARRPGDHDGPRPAGAAAASNDQIRRWARGQGRSISDYGPIPKAIRLEHARAAAAPSRSAPAAAGGDLVGGTSQG
uniref:hypothetical protein n=1 Tax=Amycolatopsis sp. CA-096443 TaxID=3239919 RepID=UPI003F4960AF